MDLGTIPHRRWNPLLEEWVLVSPQRTGRPWQGAVEGSEKPARPPYDPTCYLCPGNSRAGGTVNPHYTSVFTFTNDFPALVEEAPEGAYPPTEGMFRMLPARGICRVVCFSPRHDLSLGQLGLPALLDVIRCWGDEYAHLMSHEWIHHVMIFENRGEMMGASNPHPHGQIWATDHVPNLPARAAASQAAYHRAHGRSLLSDYLAAEISAQKRIVAANEAWVALVPFWAVWPFELMLLPRRGDVEAITDLFSEEQEEWARLLLTIATGYDRLFKVSFPWSMGIYQHPSGEKNPGFQLHQVFLPPLLRSAEVRKFMVGFELCAEPQRDLTPELAAARLREVM